MRHFLGQIILYVQDIEHTIYFAIQFTHSFAQCTLLSHIITPILWMKTHVLSDPDSTISYSIILLPYLTSRFWFVSAKHYVRYDSLLSHIVQITQILLSAVLLIFHFRLKTITDNSPGHVSWSISLSISSYINYKL